MAAGTITLTNNSDAVTGAGTAFLTDLAAGDFIVANIGGIAYTLPVKAITSDTALTIINKFTGPTMSGLAWSVATRDQQSMITAALVAQITEALRGLNYDKQNWQAVFSAAGDITVTLPDGSQFPGPSWQKIATLLEESDLEAIQPLADRVRGDALQVAADKTAATEAASTATGAATAAGDSATTATQAKADAAASQTAAAASEVSAKADADRAETAAGTIDTTAFLRKDGNLSGLADKDAARAELDVYSQQEVDDAIAAGGGGLPIGFQYVHGNRSHLNAGTVPLDGQLVQISSFSDLADYAEANETLTTASAWVNDITKRGCYVVDRAGGMMRLPDMNGVQTGSFGPIYKTGDGGTSSGTMTQNAVPNITSDFTVLSTIGLIRDAQVDDPNSAFFKKASINGGVQGGTGTSWTVGIDLSRNNKAFGRDGATRVKPDSYHGVWVVQYANAAQNQGEIDALAIDTDLQNFKATQQAANTAMNARIGYALIDAIRPGSVYLPLGTRTVFANPFGINTPVHCVAEFFHATLQLWVATTWLATSTPSFYGVNAWYNEGEGIVVRTGNNGYAAATQYGGASREFTGNVTTVGPVRIHVWKVTA